MWIEVARITTAKQRGFYDTFLVTLTDPGLYVPGLGHVIHAGQGRERWKSSAGQSAAEL